MQYTVYAKENCQWCERAKNLLTHYGFPFKVLMLEKDYTKEEILAMGVKTVPQIFVGGTRIGGYSELVEYFENHNIMGTQQ